MLEQELNVKRAAEHLAAAGHADTFGEDWAQAAANYASLASRLSPLSGGSELLDVLLERSAQCPSPSSAFNNVERLFASLEEPEPLVRLLSGEPNALNALFALFGYSQFLSDVLIRHPEWLFWLADPAVLLQARPPAVFRREVQAVAQRNAERNALRDALCLLRRREILRIGARDVLGLATAEEVSRELSDLAQAIISAAADFARQAAVARFGHPVPEAASWEVSSAECARDENASADSGGAGAPAPRPCGMCVIGMGKLGGRELNFSSDIDLVFIYEAEGETTGRATDGRRVGVVSNHQFFTRMGEELIRFLAERGPEGNLYRVDMRLRPEGADGPLVRSLESFVAYLREQARDWERVAYLKARVMAGPSQLAERLYRVTDQFVFSDVEPERIVREVEALKLRIDREVMQSDSYTRDVKRGYGGIREIEFVVAAMQIIYGKAHRALHVRNFFVAIQRLREVGLVSPEEMAFYEHAYTFLRMVEHRLQMAEENQTHTLPANGKSLEIVARRCGFLDAEAFLGEYRKITEGVHRRFMKFFEQDVAEVDRVTRDLIVILDRGADENEARAALARRGLDHPDALRLLRDLAYGTREVFVSADGQRHFEQMLPSLLRLTAAVPRPDRVLPHLHSFMHAIKGMTYYYEVIAQHPDILKLLVVLFGTSDVLAQALISRPEYFDALISTQVLHESDDNTGAVRERLAMALQPKMPRRRLVMLRRVVQFEVLLVALRFLLDLRPLRASLASLTRVADLTVETAVPLACQRLAQRHASRFESLEGGSAAVPARMEELARRHFAVAALGKYGGCELNFFGDLDVVFIYDPPRDMDTRPGWLEGWSPAEFFNELADALIAVLAENLEGGRAFVLDARLRPHGGSSPIATALDAYRTYLRTEAAVWELQAMLRLRHVWGEERLTRSVWEAFRERCAGLEPEEARREVVSMRRRLEESVAGRAGGDLELKRGLGGVVDAEFALQYLALTGRADLTGTCGDYFSQLAHLAEAAPESLRAAAVSMRDAYTVLRRLETATRLVVGEGRSTVPGDALGAAIARMVGFTGPDALDALRAALKEVMESMRQSYTLILDER